MIFTTLNGAKITKFAKDLDLFDKLVSWNGEIMEETEILSIESVFTEGYSAPLTESGTLLGERALAWTYYCSAELMIIL